MKRFGVSPARAATWTSPTMNLLTLMEAYIVH